MKAIEIFIEPLFEKAEEYGRINLELIKLKAINKSTKVISAIISRVLLFIALATFLLIINIALALWLGQLLGKSYYGFLLVALFYAILTVALYFLHPVIKQRVSNFIITQLLN